MNDSRRLARVELDKYLRQGVAMVSAVLVNPAAVEFAKRYEELLDLGRQLGLDVTETREVVDFWVTRTPYAIHDEAVNNALARRARGEDWKR